MTDYNFLKIDLAEQVCTLTISAPKSLNALNSNILKELDDFLSGMDKKEAVEKAQEFISMKLKMLGLIKRRISEAETGLILADATLDQVDLTEEPSLEEFAEMALC